MRVDWFLYHVASGHAFFSGLALISVAVVLAAPRDRRRPQAISILVVLGVLLVATSATPLPWWAYALGAGCFVAWVLAERRREHLPRRRVVVARLVLGAAIAVFIGLELPYHIAPRLVPQPRPTLAVIGDSVTAGIGENEAVTWPKRLAEQREIPVRDHSQMGANVASARKQAAKLRPEDTVVVVEIGGNDLLGGTTAGEFEVGLDLLLRDVARPGRSVVMLELPLPPTFNAYGRIQRRLAAKHGVALIPKRVLMGVFTGANATLDTIHLSQAGHDAMAEAAWQVIGAAFVESKQ